jgi:acyl carrier protein|tara:strand:+ start:209 stop:433 length:225 start_codon:yes stop_codon:yes gene_type:complete
MEEKVKQVVAESLGVDVSRVSNSSKFIDDLGADSLDVVELSMAIEEAFEVEIPEEDAEEIFTPGDIITWLQDNR